MKVEQNHEKPTPRLRRWKNRCRGEEAPGNVDITRRGIRGSCTLSKLKRHVNASEDCIQTPQTRQRGEHEGDTLRKMSKPHQVEKSLSAMNLFVGVRVGVLITHDSEYENSLRKSNERNESGEDGTRSERTRWRWNGYGDAATLVERSANKLSGHSYSTVMQNILRCLQSASFILFSKSTVKRSRPFNRSNCNTYEHRKLEIVRFTIFLHCCKIVCNE